MTATYCTVAQAKLWFENKDASLTDDAITDMIEASEGMINAKMKKDFTSIFSTTKAAHQIITHICLNLTALQMMAFNPETIANPGWADFQSAIFYQLSSDGLEQLSDDRVIKYLTDAS